MPLSDEVADFIEKCLHGDMTEIEVEDWCDDNLDNVAELYEKHGHSYMSYRDAEMTLFFAKTIYKRENMREVLAQFVTCQF
jgi:hypothetical protein|tara:strand:+ start:287 stop:529 length:243 start_codon:yes stop_codon:yes gene_type:complete